MRGYWIAAYGFTAGMEVAEAMQTGSAWAVGAAAALAVAALLAASTVDETRSAEAAKVDADAVQLLKGLDEMSNHHMEFCKSLEKYAGTELTLYDLAEILKAAQKCRELTQLSISMHVPAEYLKVKKEP